MARGCPSCRCGVNSGRGSRDLAGASVGGPPQRGGRLSAWELGVCFGEMRRIFYVDCATGSFSRCLLLHIFYSGVYATLLKTT